ncbi:hypothetical protein HK104_006932 [Borealophlyctis nickersoniae]|nr:hypothetical protein HK104_006932 [Borealophlyctis nickersoniae]
MADLSTATPADSVPAHIREQYPGIEIPTAKKDPHKLPIFSTGNYPGSVRKLNHLSRVIQGMTLERAETEMRMSVKGQAPRVVRMIRRVKSHLAHNYGRDPDQYYIARAWVGKGQYRKEINIHGRGRFGIMHHPKSHLKIEVEEREPVQTPEEKEFAKLKQFFKKTDLWVPMKDSRPIIAKHPPWSRKPWKYVTKPGWTDPNRAYAPRVWWEKMMALKKKKVVA